MDDKSKDFISFKLGTFKGYRLQDHPETLAIMNEYLLSRTSLSAMYQKDTDEQKEILYRAVDSFNGLIYNDWSGNTMTKEEAKLYIANYGKD